MRVPRKAKKQMKKEGCWFFKTNTFGVVINDTNQKIHFTHYAPFDGYITTKKKRR